MRMSTGYHALLSWECRQSSEGNYIQCDGKGLLECLIIIPGGGRQ